jgi:hypothetical protein
MYCPKCGQQQSDNAKFCNNCGKVLQAQQPPIQNQPAVTATPVSPPPINQIPVQPAPKRRKPWYKRWWIWVIIGFFGTAVLSGILNNVMPKQSKNASSGSSSVVSKSGETSKSVPTITPAEDDAADYYIVGESYEAKGLKITVDSCAEYVNDNEYYQPAEGNIYIKVGITVENTSNSDKSVGAGLFKCYVDNSVVDHEWLVGDKDNLTSYDSISPGRTVTGSLYYEVPKDASVELEFTPSYLSNSKRVVYKLK